MLLCCKEAVGRAGGQMELRAGSPRTGLALGSEARGVLLQCLKFFAVSCAKPGACGCFSASQPSPSCTTEHWFPLPC